MNRGRKREGGGEGERERLTTWVGRISHDLCISKPGCIFRSLRFLKMQGTGNIFFQTQCLTINRAYGQTCFQLELKAGLAEAGPESSWVLVKEPATMAGFVETARSLR